MDSGALQRIWERGVPFPSGPQLDFALGYAGLYQRHGLIDAGGSECSLAERCANGQMCWGALAPPQAEYAGISIPWVGREYERGGVAVIGVNFNDFGGICAHFKLAHWEMDLGLGAGRRRLNYDDDSYRGTLFAYRSTRGASLLIDVADGVAPRDRDAPAELAPAIQRIVRLQAVKCSPPSAVRARSEPTLEMWQRCPRLLIADELAIAAPRFVLAFGSAQVAWVAELGGQLAPRGEGVHEADVPLPGGGSTHVFVMPHPAAYGAAWPDGHARLVSLLAGR